MCMGGAHTEYEDFAKKCSRPISYENALLSFGSSINLTSRGHSMSNQRKTNMTPPEFFGVEKAFMD